MANLLVRLTTIHYLSYPNGVMKGLTLRPAPGRKSIHSYQDD